MESASFREVQVGGVPVANEMQLNTIWVENTGPTLYNPDDQSYYQLAVRTINGSPQLGLRKITLTAQPGETLNP